VHVRVHGQVHVPGLHDGLRPPSQTDRVVRNNPYPFSRIPPVRLFLPAPRARRLTMLTDPGFAWMAENEMSYMTPEGIRILTDLLGFEIAAHEATPAFAPRT